jgi:hypothetical protein
MQLPKLMPTAIDIYDQLPPDLIDKTTDALWEFIDAITNKNHNCRLLFTQIYGVDCFSAKLYPVYFAGFVIVQYHYAVLGLKSIPAYVFNF